MDERENNLDVLKFPENNLELIEVVVNVVVVVRDKSVCAWEDKTLSAFMVKKSAWREYLAGSFGGEDLAGVFEP
ncbi:hypothetical protein Tco_1015801 [Tanacetum coccineum]|uniref:Uncharacterized protein n=1 Tax=Tanacetum coccineum TaxID=301880 RepID=A0ABQ5FLY5_9ASTR